MKKMYVVCGLGLCLVMGESSRPARSSWMSLFDGKTLDGWKVGENASTFTVDSGCIIAHGPTAHLFYEGGYTIMISRILISRRK